MVQPSVQAQVAFKRVKEQRQFRLALHDGRADNSGMTPDPIIGHRLFVDGSVRPVFFGGAGEWHITCLHGHWKNRWRQWMATIN